MVKGYPVGILTCLLICGFVSNTFAQTGRIVPWNDGNLTSTGRCAVSYHPEPVVFVHGITASRAKWEGVISNLHEFGWFEPYHYVQQAVTNAYESSAAHVEDYVEGDLGLLFPTGEKNQWREIEQPYLHTFNYGRHAKRLADGTTRAWTRVRVSRQSHDLVETNAWQAPANDYLQGRVTLNQRVDQIREAYTIGDAQPNVLLIGHSLGGLIVCDYLMQKNANLGNDPYVPVRRAITINSLLWGSPLANLLANWDSVYLNPMMAVFKRALELGSGVAGPGLAVWIENHGNATKQALTVNLEDAVAKGDLPPMQTTNYLAQGGPFQQKLHSTPLPVTTEFITSGSKDPSPPPAQLLLGRRTGYHDIKAALEGDGAVPLNSMAGYHGDGTSVFTNISPVDIRGYEHTIGDPNATNWICNHGQAPEKMGIYAHLLAGVQYKTGFHPDGPGDWSGLQKQYTSSPNQTVSGATFTHTDEPGIARLWLFYDRGSGANPTVIDALSTWSVVSGQWKKATIGITNFVGHQIVFGAGSAAQVRYAGLVGTKNHSEDPVGFSGSNLWVLAGNEYLPASLVVQAGAGTMPVPVIIDSISIATNSAVDKCMVQIDNSGVVQGQYGYFEGITNVSKSSTYIAAQGKNIGGLLTQQAERAFDPPIDSLTIVNLMRQINELEATATNFCHAASEPTRWTAPLAERVCPSNGTFALNFYPAARPIPVEPDETDWPCNAWDWWRSEAWWGEACALMVEDAFTGQVNTNWTYDESTKTFTLTNSTNGPTCLIITYEGYLGTKNGFTTNYPGGPSFSVPPLADNALAGLPLRVFEDEDFSVPPTETILQQLRYVVQEIVTTFGKPITPCQPAPWYYSEILEAAGVGQGTPRHWSDLPSGGLIESNVFSEVQAVVGLLTNVDISCSPPCWLYFGASPPNFTNAPPYANMSTIKVTVSGVSLCNGLTGNANGTVTGITITAGSSRHGLVWIGSASYGSWNDPRDGCALTDTNGVKHYDYGHFDLTVTCCGGLGCNGVRVRITRVSDRPEGPSCGLWSVYDNVQENGSFHSTTNSYQNCSDDRDGYGGQAIVETEAPLYGETCIEY